MKKWRAFFESNLRPVEQREYGEEYLFGPPASAGQIAAFEQAIGFRLPADVRELWFEFDGVWSTSMAGRQLGQSPDIAYLDTIHASMDVPRYFAESDNPLPPGEALRKVVFVAQSNGFGSLWGVCAAEVAGHPAGAVVRLDHEAGELLPCQPSLAEFIRAGRHDDSK